VKWSVDVIKNGKNPTRKQMLILLNNKMDPDMWLVTKVMDGHIECVHRISGAVKKAFNDIRR
jgi:hypothetical protein